MSQREKDVTGDGGDLGTLTVLYEETRRSLDQQIERAESLNNRAQQILGFSIVIVSVIAAIDLRDGESNLVRGLGLASLGLFVIAAALGFLAWRFQSYRDDPDPIGLYKKYRNSEEAVTRDQVIGNRSEAIRVNAAIIKRRKRFIDAALWVLVIGVATLVALVAVRAFSADPVRHPTGVAWRDGKDARDETPGRHCRVFTTGPPAHERSHCWRRHDRRK